MLNDEDSWRATYGKEVDWWSMGALIYQMLLGQVNILLFCHSTLIQHGKLCEINSELNVCCQPTSTNHSRIVSHTGSVSYSAFPPKTKI